MDLVFRIVTVMEQPPLDHSDGRLEFVSRRRLLQLAGTAGLAAAVTACSNTSSAPPTSSPSPSAIATASTPPAAPPPEPMTSDVPAATAAPAVMLCRDAWGARPARPGGTGHNLDHLTIHHSAVVLGANSNAPGRIRQDQRYHQDSQGWIDIAYHVGVDRNGNLYQLRDPELVGDTATTYDPTGHFLVLCEGDFDKEEVTEELLHGTALACAWAAQRFAIPTATLAGHRDFAATSCPGANLYAHIASGQLKQRVEDLVAVGPVDLQSICGPEAKAIVADIEAGLR
jgi:N-acetylmuramoyl-L-alanine amidase